MCRLPGFQGTIHVLWQGYYVRAICFPGFFFKANSVVQNGYFRFFHCFPENSVFFTIFQAISGGFFSIFTSKFPFFSVLNIVLLLYFPEYFSFFEYTNQEQNI